MARMIRDLIKAGANPKLNNIHSKTALDFVVQTRLNKNIDIDTDPVVKLIHESETENGQSKHEPSSKASAKKLPEKSMKKQRSPKLVAEKVLAEKELEIKKAKSNLPPRFKPGFGFGFAFFF